MSDAGEGNNRIFAGVWGRSHIIAEELFFLASACGREPSSPPPADFDSSAGNLVAPPGFGGEERHQEEAMDHHFRTSTVLAGLLSLPGLAFAQDAPTVKVAESQEYGQYLTDADGRALYLFESDTQG